MPANPSTPLTQENADLILACVNAYAGIPNPAAELKRLREALVCATSALSDCYRDLGRVPNSPFDPLECAQIECSKCGAAPVSTPQP